MYEKVSNARKDRRKKEEDKQQIGWGASLEKLKERSSWRKTTGCGH